MTTYVCLLSSLLFAPVLEPVLTAGKWFNLGSIDLRESNTRIVMFIDASKVSQIEQAIAFHKRLGPSCSFLTITQEKPERVERILRKHRIRFPVGAGSRAHLDFGVKNFPSIMIFKPGSAETLIVDPEHFVAPASTLPAEVHTAIERIYAEDSMAHYAVEPLKKLAETFGRADPMGFLQVCDYLLSIEPPTGGREATLQDRIRWQGQIYHLRHLIDPQVKEKQSVDTPLIQAMKSVDRNAVQSILPVDLDPDLTTQSEEQIVANYLANVSTDAIPSLTRNAYLAGLTRLPDEQHRRIILRILPKETDPALRQMIACQIYDTCKPQDREAIDLLQRELAVDQNYRWSRPAIEEVLNYLQSRTEE